MSISQEIFDSILNDAGLYAQNLGSGEAKERFHLRAMIYLAKLKTINRNIHRSIDEERKQLENKKTELEKLQLTYENLIYKKNHLLREIHQCRDISTPHLEQIEQERGHQIGTLTYQDNLFPDIHDHALKELEEELESRQLMEQEYLHLQQSYADKIEVLERKRKFLEEFPKKIALIRDATADLTKEFSEGSAPSSHNNNNTATSSTSTSTVIANTVDVSEEGEILETGKTAEPSAMDVVAQ